MKNIMCFVAIVNTNWKNNEYAGETACPTIRKTSFRLDKTGLNPHDYSTAFLVCFVTVNALAA